MLPRVAILKTRIGILLSRHSVTAVGVHHADAIGEEAVERHRAGTSRAVGWRTGSWS